MTNHWMVVECKIKKKIDGWVILLPDEMQNIETQEHKKGKYICHKMLLYSHEEMKK